MRKLADISTFESLQNQANLDIRAGLSVFNADNAILKDWASFKKFMLESHLWYDNRLVRELDRHGRDEEKEELLDFLRRECKNHPDWSTSDVIEDNREQLSGSLFGGGDEHSGDGMWSDFGPYPESDADW